MSGAEMININLTDTHAHPFYWKVNVDSPEGTELAAKIARRIQRAIRRAVRDTSLEVQP